MADYRVEMIDDVYVIYVRWLTRLQRQDCFGRATKGVWHTLAPCPLNGHITDT